MGCLSTVGVYVILSCVRTICAADDFLYIILSVGSDRRIFCGFTTRAPTGKHNNNNNTMAAAPRLYVRFLVYRDTDESVTDSVPWSFDPSESCESVFGLRNIANLVHDEKTLAFLSMWCISDLVFEAHLGDQSELCMEDVSELLLDHIESSYPHSIEVGEPHETVDVVLYAYNTIRFVKKTD